MDGHNFFWCKVWIFCCNFLISSLIFVQQLGKFLEEVVESDSVEDKAPCDLLKVIQAAARNRSFLPYIIRILTSFVSIQCVVFVHVECGTVAHISKNSGQAGIGAVFSFPYTPIHTLR